MLTVRLERFRYAGAERDALGPLSLDVEAGGFVGVVGPAQAGKSTLCYLLSGFIPHFYRGRLQGDVALDGRSLRQERHAEWLSQVGIVFQNPFTQLSGARFTVAEEVAFALENAGCPPDEMRWRVADTLQTLGLAAVAERSPYALSGGQQQMVALASILVTRPRVLVLDEPTAQLDPRAAEAVFVVLQRVSEEGCTVIAAEHNPGLLAQHTCRVLALRDGVLEVDGPPRAVFGGARMEGVRRPGATELADQARSRGLWVADGPLPLSVEEAVTGFAGRLRAGEARERRIAGLGSTGKPTAAEAAAAGPGPGEVAGASPPSAAAAAASARSAEAAAASERSANAAVEVDDLHFRFGPDAEVLRGVSLRVARGERVALMGHNGAGKSTLARHLVGLLIPTAGRVRVMGWDVGGRAGFAARHAAYVFQNPDDQLFTRRAWDEVAYGPRNLGAGGEELQRVVAAALEAVGMSHMAHANPRDLDLPLRKRLALASVIAMPSPVLVLDEPTGNLDAQELARLASLLDALSKAGRTVVVITHDVEFCAEHFPRMVAMAGGRMVADGPPARVFADATARAAAGLEPPATLAVADRLRGGGGRKSGTATNSRGEGSGGAGYPLSEELEAVPDFPAAASRSAFLEWLGG